MAGYSLRVEGSILSIDRAAWNSCPAASCPFLSWEFHALLEASGAVGTGGAVGRPSLPATGPLAARSFVEPGPVAGSWTPFHVVLSREGRDVAYLPLYVVGDSAGSFVWDDGVEAAARSVGLRWYPKLAGAVPFTPAPIWRPLVAPGEDEPRLIEAALAGLAEAASEGGFSGIHLHWTDPIVGAVLSSKSGESAGDVESGGEYPRGERPRGGGRRGGGHGGQGAARWTEWKRQAYLWENRAYRDFDDFTASFSKNMRRNVGRDRADVREAGVALRMLRGDEAGQGIWRSMAALYARTNDRFGPWAARFLPDAFFELAPHYIGASTLFSAAYESGSDDPFALALLFRGPETLWGRYWGTSRDVPGLHFETCYYAPIEYAIREGIPFFDPGMGGDHKARRGFGSILASSWHLVFDPRLGLPFAAAIRDASEAEAGYAKRLDLELPFRKDLEARP